MPRFAGDALPVSQPGLIIGLADRLDSLVGLFAAGLKPTGTRDPFALRRAALGIVQVLVGAKLHVDLCTAVALAADLLPIAAGPAVQSDVLDYVVQRLRGVLLEQELRYDVIDAVLAERGHDPYLAEQTALRLNDWVQRDDWMDLLNAYARCVRIVRSQETRYAVEPDQFTEQASVALHKAVRQIQETLDWSTTTDVSSIDQVLQAIQSLVPTINAFFDEVLVMAPEPAIRANRLALVQEIASLTDGVADLSRLEGF